MSEIADREFYGSDPPTLVKSACFVATLGKTTGVLALIGIFAASCSSNRASPSASIARAIPSAAVVQHVQPPSPSTLRSGTVPSSLFDELDRTLGPPGPVAIVPAEDGIVALSFDGARKRVLVPGRAEWVLVDDRAHVVWFQPAAKTTTELLLLDLTQPSPKVESVVTGLPERELVAVGYAGATSNDTDIVVPPMSEYDGHVELLLSRHGPSLKFTPGQYDSIFEEQGQNHEQRASRSSIVEGTAARLRELAERGIDRRLLLRAAPPSKTAKVSAVNPKQCEDPDLCGSAESIPGTRFLRVLVEHSCGDACHVRWQLYDPETQEFIDFKSQRRSRRPIQGHATGDLRDAFVSRDGQGFIIDGAVYKFDGSRVFAGDGRGGGWLGGQWHVGL